MLYPLKFKPILKPKIWGGDKLYSKSSLNLRGQKIGESWEISGVEGDISIIENGDFRGLSFQNLIDKFKDELVGKSVYDRFQNKFPILIKFIEAKENLSVQLHPDDKLAKKRHNSFGKTEMWYLLETEPNSELIIDFNESMTLSKYQKLIDNGTLESGLNSFKVNEGEVFFIKPGLVHAIGAGVLLAEIQQTSDITYRLYDWNRKDVDGNPRELHTDLALDAINFNTDPDYKVQYTPKLNSRVLLVDTPFFKTNIIDLKGVVELNYSELDSFVILMNVGKESAILSYNDENYYVSPLQTIFIPASLDILSIYSKATKLLEISI